MFVVICTCLEVVLFFFFKHKTAYDMRISDWGSDVCSSDLAVIDIEGVDVEAELIVEPRGLGAEVEAVEPLGLDEERRLRGILRLAGVGARLVAAIVTQIEALAGLGLDRQDRAPRRLEIGRAHV